MMRKPLAVPQTAWLIALLVALTLPAWAQAQGDSVSWSAEDCAACHGDNVAAFQRGPHAILDREPDRLPEGAELSCSACHGDVTTHMDEGGGAGTIFSFGEDVLASERSATCESCHADTHPRFAQSPHARAGLDCTSCHSIHAADDTWSLLKTTSTFRSPGRELAAGTSACIDCHQEVFTQFQFNERHRLQEGILDCTSCHNPHEPATRAHLGGFKQEACVDCHTDKGGPFVFEHASSRVEGCVACHSPHGSPNRHLLKFQNLGELCYSCHAEVPQFHLGFNPAAPPRFGLDANCTNCHSSIHGSNFDPFFLK